jgi:uncharacterized protein
VIHLDTSAAYTLLSRESQISEVEALFADRAELLSSQLLEVELQATVRRRGGSLEDVAAILRRVELDAVDDEIIDHALSLQTGLRALDALPLSAALLYGADVSAIAIYDRELVLAAQHHGLAIHR